MAETKRHTIARHPKKRKEAEFSGVDLMRINIATGEGFNNIRNLWAEQGYERLPADQKEGNIDV